VSIIIVVALHITATIVRGCRGEYGGTWSRGRWDGHLGEHVGETATEDAVGNAENPRGRVDCPKEAVESISVGFGSANKYLGSVLGLNLKLQREATALGRKLNVGAVALTRKR